MFTSRSPSPDLDPPANLPISRSPSPAPNPSAGPSSARSSMSMHSSPRPQPSISGSLGPNFEPDSASDDSSSSFSSSSDISNDPQLPLHVPPGGRPYTEPVELHFLGPMNIQCPNCHAFHFISEKLINSDVHNPHFGLCCLQGQVNLPPMQQWP